VRGTSCSTARPVTYDILLSVEYPMQPYTLCNPPSIVFGDQIERGEHRKDRFLSFADRTWDIRQTVNRRSLASRSIASGPFCCRKTYCAPLDPPSPTPTSFHCHTPAPHDFENPFSTLKMTVVSSFSCCTPSAIPSPSPALGPTASACSDSESLPAKTGDCRIAALACSNLLDGELPSWWTLGMGERRSRRRGARRGRRRSGPNCRRGVEHRRGECRERRAMLSSALVRIKRPANGVERLVLAALRDDEEPNAPGLSST
jgi:hypothetical protein